MDSKQNEIDSKVETIKSKWRNNLFNVCSKCMGEAIRHFDRNMEPACISYDEKEDYEETSHPKRYDGELYADAGGDISELLNIIDILKSKIQELQTQTFESE